MKKRIVIYCVAIIAIILAGYFIATYYEEAHNPLKSLYRAGKERNYEELQRMENISLIYNKNSMGEYGDFFWIDFEESSIRKGCDITLYFYEKSCSILGRYYLDEEEKVRMVVNINYAPVTNLLRYMTIHIYDEKTKKEYTDSNDVIAYMEKYNISEDAVKEFQHYILYDVVVQRWISRDNKQKTVAEEDFKMITFEDHTFDFDWRGTE